MKTILVISLLFYLSSKGQTINYSKFVHDHLINKNQTVKTSATDKEDIIYLGKIKDKNGKTLFYILTIYSQVQAAIVIHGHSNIIYLDNNKNFKKLFHLGSPQDLPYKLKNNHLYFRYKDSKTNKKKLYINYVGEQIPKILCVGPDDCY